MGFVLYKCYINNLKLKLAIPHLLVGEKVRYFKLIGVDSKVSNKIDLSVLNTNKISIIFISDTFFLRSCQHS